MAISFDMRDIKRNFIVSGLVAAAGNPRRLVPRALTKIRASGELTVTDTCRRASTYRPRGSGSIAVCLVGAALMMFASVAGCAPGVIDIDIDVGPQPPHASNGAQRRNVTTIDEAIDFVRKDAASRKGNANYRVNLGAQPLVLDRPLIVAGLKPIGGSRVIFAGRPGGTRISGGFRADKYLKPAGSPDGTFRYTLALSDLPPETQRRLFAKLAVASPKQIMIRANGSTALWPTRWPDQGFVKVLEIKTDPATDVARMSLAALPPDMKNSPTGIWVGGYLTDSYLFVNARAKAADPRGIAVERTRLRADGLPPERISLYNLPWFTQCNSFFYDPGVQSFSFCAQQPIESLEVASLETLLDVSRSDNLTFENIVFELATGTAVAVRDSSAVNFTNVVVQEAGGDGIAYAASTNSVVSHATVREVGGRAVWLSGGDRPTLSPSGLVLEDSELMDFSLISRTFAPAVQADGVGDTVRRNLIFNGPQSGVIYSGNDHVFEDNVMAQLVGEAGDSGFIYTARDFTSQGNIVRRNILIGTGGQYFNDARGIYLDEFSSGNLVAGNVIVGVPFGVVMNGGKDNALLSNLFVLSTPSIWASALGYEPWWQQWRNDHMQIPNGASVKNLFSLPINDKVWTDHYPELQSYAKSDLLKPERNRIEGNIFLGGGSITAEDGDLPTATLKSNEAVIFRGSLQLLERLRYPIGLDQLPQMLALVVTELDRHGIRDFPLRMIDPVGAHFANDGRSEVK
jgi:hypothetical protein